MLQTPRLLSARHGPPLFRLPRAALLRGGAAYPFTTSVARSKKVQYPPRPKPPPEEEILESFLKGSGPGGQKINKTNSAVQLKHVPTGIVVKCQETRSREQNRKIARDLLATRLDDQLNGENSRSAIVARINARKKASAAKKTRRKYRKLEEEEGEDPGTDEGEIDELAPGAQDSAPDGTKPQRHEQTGGA
ncbi:hypothetical protein NKR23_g6351 [Pleurostoma richardsiae]|uniref:Prokaryotic-type class I peptide chain release factors domain-containing protein n=1 Tax=Pleurostoma richardsiae TaxID=41990 RepID=A0AA38RQ28_9PEZI|nr:hypothetical protein NKR23_g6351 [Pleurostoma richardsiae]